MFTSLTVTVKLLVALRLGDPVIGHHGRQRVGPRPLRFSRRPGDDAGAANRRSGRRDSTTDSSSVGGHIRVRRCIVHRQQGQLIHRPVALSRQDRRIVHFAHGHREAVGRTQAGRPSSVTTVVSVYSPRPLASLGVQVITPVLPIAAPAGALNQLVAQSVGRHIGVRRSVVHRQQRQLDSPSGCFAQPRPAHCSHRSPSP